MKRAGQLNLAAMPVSALAPLLEAAKGRLPRVIDVPAPSESDLAQLRDAVTSALLTGKDTGQKHAKTDLQDILHITSKLWVRSPCAQVIPAGYVQDMARQNTARQGSTKVGCLSQNKCVDTKNLVGQAPGWQLQLRQLARHILELCSACPSILPAARSTTEPTCVLCSDLLSLLKDAELPAGWQGVPFKLHFQVQPLLSNCSCSAEALLLEKDTY